MKELDLIQKYYQKYGAKMFVATSGGKDSTVILDLALKVNPLITIIHNPKPVTHPETIKFLYELSQKVNIFYIYNMPKYIIQNNLKCQIDGTRISEFNRTDKSWDIIINGQTVSRTEMTNHGEGIWGLENIYPIYDWTDEDVFQYCRDNKLPLSKEYTEYSL